MAEFDTRSMISAAAAAAASSSASNPTPPRPLSEATLALASLPVARAYSPIVLAGIVRMLEFMLIAAVGTAIYAAYVVPIDGVEWPYPAQIAAIAAVSVFAFQTVDIYHVQAFRGHGHPFARLAATWTLVFLLIMAVSFFAKIGSEISRVWLASFFVIGLLVLVAFRAGLFLFVRHWVRTGRLDRRTVVVGADAHGEALIDSIESQHDSDVKIIGVFDDRGDDRATSVCAGHLKLGNVSDLVEFARRTRIDLVLFALPITAEVRILQMLKKLWVLPVDIRLSAHTNKLRFRPRSYSYIGTLPVLDVFDRPITDWDVVMKWLFDRVVGALLLLLLSPVMLLTALAIKLDSRGPVFFKQKRHGFNNETIEVFKFRSMYADRADPMANKPVTKGDPRVTRVGRFIRKSSIDELPQLFNVVFKGNLSLVGPRPHPVQLKVADRMFDEAVDGYFARHRVKPGITGWAQINGLRGEVTSQEKIQRRVDFDLYYIENWSVLFDLYIMAMTPIALLRTENAY